MTNYSYNTIMSFMIKKTHAHGYYRIYYYDQVLGDHLPPPPFIPSLSYIRKI